MKRVFILVMLCLFLGGLVFVLYPKDKSFESKVQVNTEKNISLNEIAQHSLSSDCWMAIDGGVYDVTEYISSHPGGKLIIDGCGKDASEMFHNRPDREPDHSEDAVNLLKKFQIGKLSN